MNFAEFIGESFDKSLPIEREIPPIAYVADQWQFEMGSKTHAVRFERGERFGKKSIEIRSGIIRGKKISPKITGVTDIRLYLSTVMKAVEEAIENPTIKLKQRRDGFVLVIPSKIYEKFGYRIARILRMRFRGKYNVSDLDEFPFSDSYNAIYLVRQGKRFDAVFNKIADHFTIPTPVFSKPEPVLQEPVKTPLDFDRPPEEIEPERNVDPIPADPSGKTELTPTSFDTKSVVRRPFEDKVDQVEKERKKAVLDTVPTIEEAYDTKDAKKSWYNVLYHTTLQRKSYSFNEDDPIVEQKDLELALWYERNVGAPELDNMMLCAALDLSGYGVKDIYSDYGKNYFSNGIHKSYVPSISAEELWKKIPQRKATFEKVYPIMLNYEEVFKTKLHALGIQKWEKPKHSGTLRSSYFSVNYHKFTDEQLRDMLYRDLQSASDIPDEDIFVEREEGEGKDARMQKRIAYEYQLKEKGYTVVSTIFNSSAGELMRRAQSADEVFALVDTTPKYHTPGYFGLLSNDHEVFKRSFIGTWLSTGGTISYSLTGEGGKNLGINNEMLEENFWVHNSEKDGGFASTDVKKEVLQSPRVQSHLGSLYAQTQEFYRNKYGKKYDSTVVKLYRGVGVDNLEKYIPSPAESWSKDKSTGKRFAKMMSKHKYSNGTIMYAEVPIQYILMSYEAQRDYWAAEKNLKGKKEFVVMGGAFNHVPIYEYDPYAKEVGTQTLSFAEFTMNEEKYKEGEKQIKIVPPKKKDTNTGLGVDPNEWKTRGKIGETPSEE